MADASHGGLNTLGDAFPYQGVDLSGMETVDVLTLDEFWREHASPRIGVIKIDVEGFEVAVLEGARRVLAQDRPTLIVEVLSPALAACGTSVADLQQRLEASGYALCAIGEDAGLRATDSLHAHDGENVLAVPHERVQALLRGRGDALASGLSSA